MTTAELTDKKLNCRECRTEFTFTAGEQRFYHEKGLNNLPNRCRSCRTKRRTRPIPDEDTRRGTVKWFSAPKGYGFLIPEDPAEPEVYVHFTQIVAKGYASLVAGQQVEFNLAHTERGPAAAHVRVLEEGQ